jgi:glyoxylase-like metal-dependent hydrolase (beta-lactamase superfamily II)
MSSLATALSILANWIWQASSSCSKIVAFLRTVITQHVVAAHIGDRIDLGDRSLTIYGAPGHTPRSLVIFDEQTGNLFTGDSFGSNSPTIPDTLWLQWNRTPLDEYLAMVKTCRANL